MDNRLINWMLLPRRTFAAAALGLMLGACAAPNSSPVSLADVLAAPERSTEARARDVYRHPRQTLEFFEVTPGLSVLEIDPGNGWYTDILAPFLREHGKLYEALYEPPQASPESAQSQARVAAFASKLEAAPARYGAVSIGTLRAGRFSGFGPTLQVDRVLTFRNIHNWIEDGQLDVNLRAFYAALKPGGILGVVEHRAPPGTSVQRMSQSGYVSEAFVIEHAQAAGFELAAESEINGNPRDTKDYPNGVWSLPPTYRGGSVDRQRYAAIGESDRMTLRFVKPAP